MTLNIKRFGLDCDHGTMYLIVVNGRDGRVAGMNVNGRVHDAGVKTLKHE